MAFRSEHIQVDGSINIDGSIFQWNQPFVGGGGGGVSDPSKYDKTGGLISGDVSISGALIANSIRIKTANNDSDALCIINGPLTLAQTTTADYKTQFEINSNTTYINSNTYYAGGWNLYDSNRAPAQIKLTSDNANSIISFATNNANTAPSERLRITSTGKIIATSPGPATYMWQRSGAVPGYTYSDGNGSGISNADPYSELVYLNATTNSINFYTSGAWAARIDSAQFSTTGRSWVNILSPSFPNISGSIDHSGNSNGFTIISQTDSAGNKASGAISFFTSVNSSAATEKCRITPDGQFSANNGTESLPGIVFQGDQDTGFFLNNTAAIGVCLGGDEKYRFTGGNFHAAGDGIFSSTTTPSDRRLKKNIKFIENSLETISKLEGVSFELISNDQKKLGLIAQDVEPILPEVVCEHEMMDGKKYKMIDYPSLIPVLINAINEQQKQITELKRIIYGHS